MFFEKEFKQLKIEINHRKNDKSLEEQIEFITKFNRMYEQLCINYKNMLKSSMFLFEQVEFYCELLNSINTIESRGLMKLINKTLQLKKIRNILLTYYFQKNLPLVTFMYIDCTDRKLLDLKVKFIKTLLGFYMNHNFCGDDNRQYEIFRHYFYFLSMNEARFNKKIYCVLARIFYSRFEVLYSLIARNKIDEVKILLEEKFWQEKVDKIQGSKDKRVDPFIWTEEQELYFLIEYNKDLYGLRYITFNKETNKYELEYKDFRY